MLNLNIPLPQNNSRNTGIDKFASIFTQLTGVKKPGYLQVLENVNGLKECQQRAKEICTKYQKLVVLGIGGSSLGARTIIQAFGKEDTVLFFENADALSFELQLQKIKNFSSVHWAVVSKSGKTLETLMQLHIVEQFLKDKNIRLTDHCTVISEKKDNPLSTWARKNNISLLEIPENVGGRFSVLTPVGLFPAAFAGLDVQSFYEGAKECLHNSKVIVNFCEQIIDSWQRSEWITILWVYSDLLKNFGLWFQQLWAESLGKKNDVHGQPAHRASTPMPLVGTNDQHSILQQIVEGPRDKFVIFLNVKAAENAGESILKSEIEGFEYLKNKKMGDVLKALRLGTQKSLKEYGVHSMTLEIEKINERNLGMLFLFFEIVVSMLGEYHNINTYDQPGVELSKKLAIDILKSSTT